MVAAALAVFVTVQIAMPLWIRPHVIPPKTAAVAITSANISEMTVDHDSKFMQGGD